MSFRTGSPALALEQKPMEVQLRLQGRRQRQRSAEASHEAVRWELRIRLQQQELTAAPVVLWATVVSWEALSARVLFRGSVAVRLQAPTDNQAPCGCGVMCRSSAHRELFAENRFRAVERRNVGQGQSRQHHQVLPWISPPGLRH